MTQDRKRTAEELTALEEIGFKPGEAIRNLHPHINPKNSEPCGGDVGTVLDITDGGAIVYVECNTCHDILQEEL